MADKQYKLLTEELIISLSHKASELPRKRRNYNFHELNDNVQRMLNAIEPDSYVRPHKHELPAKVESFILLSGKLGVIFYSDDGKVTDHFILDKEIRGVDIKPGAWHTIVSLQPGTVIFEVKDGPYVHTTDKEFAAWAPEENTKEADEFLEKMRKIVTAEKIKK